MTLAFFALIIFVLAYGLVIFEELHGIRKSVPMIVAAGVIWAVVFASTAPGLAAARETFFSFVELAVVLVGTAFLVATIEACRGFDVLQARMAGLGLSARQVFLLLGMVTFLLSSFVPNMTTALVMGAVAAKLAKGDKVFLTLACVNIVVAANAGGAFCAFLHGFFQTSFACPCGLGRACRHSGLAPFWKQLGARDWPGGATAICPAAVGQRVGTA
jgi:Na+/H+ antiporter NhaD/arsenite permease-like protein